MEIEKKKRWNFAQFTQISVRRRAKKEEKKEKIKFDNLADKNNQRQKCMMQKSKKWNRKRNKRKKDNEDDDDVFDDNIAITKMLKLTVQFNFANQINNKKKQKKSNLNFWTLCYFFHSFLFFFVWTYANKDQVVEQSNRKQLRWFNLKRKKEETKK